MLSEPGPYRLGLGVGKNRNPVTRLHFARSITVQRVHASLPWRFLTNVHLIVNNAPDPSHTQFRFDKLARKNMKVPQRILVLNFGVEESRQYTESFGSSRNSR